MLRIRLVCSTGSFIFECELLRVPCAGTSRRFAKADELSRAVSYVARRWRNERARLDAHTQRTNKSEPQCHLETVRRNLRKMLLRTARAAPRLLRTAHRHKASSVVATVSTVATATPTSVAALTTTTRCEDDRQGRLALRADPRTAGALVPRADAAVILLVGRRVRSSPICRRRRGSLIRLVVFISA